MPGHLHVISECIIMQESVPCKAFSIQCTLLFSLLFFFLTTKRNNAADFIRLSQATNITNITKDCT